MEALGTILTPILAEPSHSCVWGGGTHLDTTGLVTFSTLCSSSHLCYAELGLPQNNTVGKTWPAAFSILNN